MPPENAGYMYAAYVAAGIIYAGYALSIWWRFRAVARRYQRDSGAPTAHVDR
jgi:hypothetical protein